MFTSATRAVGDGFGRAAHGRSMRIALVTESFHPAVDDDTTTVRHVADRLVDLGHDVLVVAAAPGLTSYRSAHVARIRTMEPVGRRSPGHQVRDALAAFGPDLLHVMSPGAVGSKALKHGRRMGVPALVVQTEPLTRGNAEAWHRTVLPRADHVVVTCRWMQALLGSYGARSVPVWTPGVDPRAFDPALAVDRLRERWTRGGRVAVGHAGALRKRHGVRDLAGLAGLADVRPVLLGDGPQRGWLERRLPGVHVSGSLGSSDLAAALASLDVLVQPGTRQTCGHLLRAAAASGVPVVAPAAGGAPDVVRHEHGGLLYDPEDPRGLVRAVGALVADPGRRADLGRQARERAVLRTWPDAVDQLVRQHYLPLLAVGAPAA